MKELYRAYAYTTTNFIIYWPEMAEDVASITDLTDCSNNSASVDVWNASPNLRPAVLQWWNVGLAQVYSRLLSMEQSSMT